MRKMNFNSFRKDDVPENNEVSSERVPVRNSAYRTVMAHHRSVADKLKNEPISIIKTND